MKKLLIMLAVLISFASFCQEDAGDIKFTNENQKYQISIYKLAANPEKYNEKPVFITGFAGTLYGLTIFPDKSSCEAAFEVNGIQVNFNTVKHDSFIKSISSCKIISVFGKYINLNNYGKDKFQNLTLGFLEGPVELYTY